MKITFYKKIILAMSVLIFFITFISVFSYYTISKLKKMVINLETDMFLDERVTDHYKWINALQGAIRKGEVFNRELDPRNCAFGKWYYSFKDPDPLVMREHSFIEELHTRLHESAKKVLALRDEGNQTGAFELFEKTILPVAEVLQEHIGRLQSVLMSKVGEDKQQRGHVVGMLVSLLMAICFPGLILSILVTLLIIMITRKVTDKIQGAINQISSAGSEILAATQQQASSVREQSSAVSETASASKELSVSSEKVGESIRRVSQVALHALEGMKNIKESIQKTGNLIASLGEKSQQIGKITDVIDDVADQTNLLAVNASIEAARAGEQGRGFTVVADEIRKLSDATAKSTKDITALIELIQHEMSNSVMAMEQSIRSVDEEAKLAQKTSEEAKEIAMSSNQQISGSKQIAEAISSINNAMKEIALGAQESQAAVRQLNELSSDLDKLVKMLR